MGNLNTSNVNVNLKCCRIAVTVVGDLNTSNVNVNQIF